MTALLFSLEFHLKIAGATLIFLGLSHAFFGPRFHWREELARLSLLNRQIFYVHNFFIALVCVGMGILSVFGARGLIERTFLGQWICAALAVFWGLRLGCQFLVYSQQLWRGKRLETAMHLLFSLGWTYYTAVFGWAWWLQTFST